MFQKPLTGVDAFGVAFDNLLNRPCAEIARWLRLYAILYNRQVVSDSWLLTNSGLQQALDSPDGHLLLREGILVAARRDSAPTFEAFLGQARGKNMHGLTATDEFAQMLDREAGENAIVFPLKSVAESYVGLARKVLQPSVLMALGVSEAAAAVVDHMVEDAIAGGVDWKTNTFVKDVVCPALSDAHDQATVMDAARAPYSLSLPELLGSGIICTEEFQGDKVLAAIKQNEHAIGSVSVTTSAAPLERFSARVDDPRIGWLLTTGIAEFTTHEICLFRSSPRRDLYLFALQEFFRIQNAMTWGSLRVALSDYLSDGLDMVMQQRNLAIKDTDAQIAADTALHVTAEDQGVQLKGLTADATVSGMEAAVTIVGRTMHVPERESEVA